MLGEHERNWQHRQTIEAWLGYAECYLTYRDALSQKTRDLCDRIVRKIKDNPMNMDTFIKVLGAVIQTDLDWRTK
jgi:hypothetical protein